MLSAKARGHQVTPLADLALVWGVLRCWVSTSHTVGMGQRGVSSFENQGLKNDSNISLLQLKPLKLWCAPSRSGEEQGTDFTPPHCTCRCILEMSDRTRRAPACSSGISRREMWPSLCSRRCSAVHRTGPSPGWINFSFVPSILPPAVSPWLLLLLCFLMIKACKALSWRGPGRSYAINTSSYHRRHSCGLGSAKSVVLTGISDQKTVRMRWGQSSKELEGSIKGRSFLLEEGKEPQPHWPASEEWQSGPYVVLLLCSYPCSTFPCKANFFHLQRSGITNGLNTEKTNNYNT